MVSSGACGLGTGRRGARRNLARDGSFTRRVKIKPFELAVWFNKYFDSAVLAYLVFLVSREPIFYDDVHFPVEIITKHILNRDSLIM